MQPIFATFMLQRYEKARINETYRHKNVAEMRIPLNATTLFCSPSFSFALSLFFNSLGERSSITIPAMNIGTKRTAKQPAAGIVQRTCGQENHSTYKQQAHEELDACRCQKLNTAFYNKLYGVTFSHVHRHHPTHSNPKYLDDLQCKHRNRQML